jgi:phosphoribosyl 1,2-cyclic phosphodiesterase
VASGHKDATSALYILGLGLTVTVQESCWGLLVSHSHLDHTEDFDWGIPHTSYSLQVYFIQYNVVLAPSAVVKYDNLLLKL